MALDPITAIFNFGSTLIEKLIPDKTAQNAAKAQLTAQIIAGEYDTAKGQLAVDLAEAQNPNIFIAGWRPGLGWICVLALFYSYILQPFIVLILVVCHSNFDQTKLPVLNTAQILSLIGVLLGLVGSRTVEKMSGVDTTEFGGK